MLAYFAIAGIAFGIAYWIFSTGGASTWRAVGAFFAGQILGWLGGTAIDLMVFTVLLDFDAKATTLQLLGRGFWWAAFGAGYGVFRGRRKLKTTNATLQSATSRTSAPKSTGEDPYAAALAEIEEGRLDKGVWARSFAESGGDESRAKALYINARAEAIKTASVWLDTQQPDADGNRVEVVQLSRSPANYESLPKWVPVFIVFMVIAGIVMYQELSNRQTAAATPVQASAPQVDWSQFTPLPPAKTAPVERSQIDEFLDEASKPTSWDSYVQKVRGLEAAVNRGELPQVDGVISFAQPAYSTQWSSADAAALESEQTWWRNESGSDFHIHVSNSTSNSLAVLGLEYSESDCKSNGEKRRFFVTLPKPLATGTQSVIHFKPELTESKKNNNCLVIFSAS